METIKPLIEQFGSENIYNSHQSGFQLKIHSGLQNSLMTVTVRYLIDLSILVKTKLENIVNSRIFGKQATRAPQPVSLVTQISKVRYLCDL